jgi:hypothetical protein
VKTIIHFIPFLLQNSNTFYCLFSSENGGGKGFKFFTLIFSVKLAWIIAVNLAENIMNFVSNFSLQFSLKKVLKKF